MSKPNTKYQYVVDHVRQNITSGCFQLNDKLPSIRQLSEQLGVSKNTVIRAYEQLEAVGEISPHPRSGFRVANQHQAQKTQSLPPSQVDLIGLSRTILNQPLCNNFLHAGSAHPNTDFPAIRSLYAEIGRHSRYQTHIPSHYQIPPGNETLIKQLVHINRSIGINTSANDILITHGAQQAISLALQAVTVPGDIVLVDSPCYFGTLLLLESLNLKVVEVPANPSTGMDLKALEQALQTWPVKAIVVNPSFNNPTGYLMPTAARETLLELAGDIPIIEDDVFGALAYQEQVPTLKSLDKNNRVIFCSSLSKTLDSRLRIGWILAGKYRDKIEQRLLCDNMGSLNLMQSAVGEFLTSGKYRQHVQTICRTYRKNQKLFFQHLVEALNQYPQLEGRYHLSQPQGGFLCWLSLPKQVDTFVIYQQALNHNISILPGCMFGTQGQFNHCIRLSFANYEPTKQWDDGLKVLAGIIAGEVIEI
ncbi:transcriptional regulator [Photobacterium jeanii]|uniref:Transcriptional regulator n=1 Tax=Photobacterium jeanii TaxID=858640 RepID=A0A178KAZ1_9GAMM|nr:PLP-dependent aminotransferase family protein [Photobacterium jeanii]OAN13813.1 transcriptional regulator [Photobacterium jeanii]PST92725.1 PLP-dependent aminotransferase family protein [Photobacterium jeanii]